MNTPDPKLFVVRLTPELEFYFEKVLRLLLTNRDRKWVSVELLRSPKKPPHAAWILLASKTGFDDKWATQMYQSWEPSNSHLNYAFQDALDHCDATTSILFRMHTEIVSLEGNTAKIRVLNPTMMDVLKIKFSSFVKAFRDVSGSDLDIQLVDNSV
jgi:hypothetical protein